MYYVYILKSIKDKKLYVGCTKDLKKRINMHNSRQVFSTKFRRPFEIIYYEAYKNKEDAFEREKFLKTGWGRNYIRQVLKHYFENLGG